MQHNSLLPRASVSAALFFAGLSAALGGSGSFLHFEPEFSLSSNPSFETGYDGESIIGGSYQFAASFDKLNSINPYAGGRITFYDYEGDDTDFYEYNAATGLRYGQYTISRLVKPRGPDLSGLHPRTVQDFRTSFILYDLTVESTTFEEDSLSKYDSSRQLHLISYMTPISLDSDWLLFGSYNWALHESDDLVGYSSRGGELALLVPLDIDGGSGALSPCLQYMRSGVHLTDQSLLRQILGKDVLVLMTGWQRLAEFDGPGAPNGDTSIFLGEFALAKRRGRFAAGLEIGQRPAPSLTSAYQTDRWMRAAVAMSASSRWSVGTSVQHLTADRSSGDDASLFIVEANAQWDFGNNWKAYFQMEWRERDSQTPDDDYAADRISVSIRWDL